MLAYHPAQDATHSTHRALVILSDCGGSLQADLFRMIDFFVLFPKALLAARIPANIAKIRTEIRRLPTSYEILFNPRRMMFELALIQDQAIRSLVAKKILDRDAFARNELVLLQDSLSPSIRYLISSSSVRQRSWYRPVLDSLREVRVEGRGGLKDRSGLMEFRYDPESQG